MNRKNSCIFPIGCQGGLLYDDSTGIISGNGKEYLGFNVGKDWT